MSFKDYFSSDSWFNGVQGHLMNMALTDYNEKWAKPYIAKEYLLSGFDIICGLIVGCVSNSIRGGTHIISTPVKWLWKHTVGGLFNSADNHNDKNIVLDKTETKSDIQDLAIHESHLVPPEFPPVGEAAELNALKGEILDPAI